MSHEMRTPLNGLLGMLQLALLSEECANTTELKRQLQQAALPTAPCPTAPTSLSLSLSHPAPAPRPPLSALSSLPPHCSRTRTAVAPLRHRFDTAVALPRLRTLLCCRASGGAAAALLG